MCVEEAMGTGVSRPRADRVFDLDGGGPRRQGPGMVLSSTERPQVEPDAVRVEMCGAGNAGRIGEEHEAAGWSCQLKAQPVGRTARSRSTILRRKVRTLGAEEESAPAEIRASWRPKMVNAPSRAPSRPIGPVSGSLRTVRVGAWISDDPWARRLLGVRVIL